MLTTARIVPGTGCNELEFEDCRPELRQIHDLWTGWRGDRDLPARADFYPEDIPADLLPHLVLYDVTENAPLERRYRIRLMGTAQVDFHGRDWTGRFPHDVVPEDRAVTLCQVAEEVVRNRGPWLTEGQVYSMPSRPRARFQSIQLPLSSDQQRVDMILGLSIFYIQ